MRPFVSWPLRFIALACVGAGVVLAACGGENGGRGTDPKAEPGADAGPGGDGGVVSPPGRDGATAATDIPAFRIGSGTVYHVATTGNDAGGDGSSARPWRTINRAISAVGAGDTIDVHKGRYIEDTTTSPYVRPRHFFEHPCSLAPVSSGSAAEPITLRAHPGDEGSVTIASENVRCGVFVGEHDHWQLYGLRFVDSWAGAIARTGQNPSVTLDLEQAATGWRIENVLIEHTTGPRGGNPAAVQMWGTNGWLVHNVWIHDVRDETGAVASGFLAYGLANALIDHVRVEQVSNGIYWKDHHQRTESPRARWESESEVRSSWFDAKDIGVGVGIRGDGSTEASHNRWHHNIVVGAANGFYENMAGSGRLSGAVRLEHNLVFAPGGENGIFASASEGLYSRGNVVIGPGAYLAFQDYTPFGFLRESDYNVVSGGAGFGIGLFGASRADDRWYPTLAEWQAATKSAHPTLTFDRPDEHTVLATPRALFVNAEGRDFHHAAGSPAVGMMPDGTNAGPYQRGDEIVGLLPSYSAGTP